MSNELYINADGNLQQGEAIVDLNDILDKLSSAIQVHVGSTPPEQFKLLDKWYTDGRYYVATIVDGSTQWVELPFTPTVIPATTTAT